VCHSADDDLIAASAMTQGAANESIHELMESA